MTKLKRNIFQLSFILMLPLMNVLYFILNSSNRGMHNLVTDIDRTVPFLKIFIFPYILWYPFIYGCLLYFFFKDRKTYFKTLISLVLGISISYIIYFLFQTTVPRPDVLGNDIAARLVKFIYSKDMPYNCFPSLHVYESYIMIKAIRSSQTRNLKSLLLICTTAILIILSTQFIKQHVILDMISAILLGDIIYKAVNLFSYGGIKDWIRKPYLSLMMKKRLES